MTGLKIAVRRIYDESLPDDGVRVLVDRLWPRGLSKAKAQFDQWCKAVAPSTALRTWYGHDPALFDEFARRYRAELGEGEQAEAFAALQSLRSADRLTLLTATKEVQISAAVVLAKLLERDSKT